MQRVKFTNEQAAEMAKFIVELVKANTAYSVTTIGCGWYVEVTGY